MARVLVFAAIAALVLTVFAVVDCALTERSRVRALPKAVWIVVALVLPVIGPLLWLLIGRGPAQQRTVRRVIGPDDDPEFLRSNRAPRAAIEPPDDEHWRALEQELANLDSDTDDDGEPGRR